MLFPRKVRETNGVTTIRGWFDAADKDNSQSLSVNEFFVWTLQNAASEHGARTLRAICETFDTNRSGTLDRLQFQKLCWSIGYGEHEYAIFRDLDVNRRRQIDYGDLEAQLIEREEISSEHAEDSRPPLSSVTKELLSALIWSEVETELSAEAAEDLKAQASGWQIKATDAHGVRAALQQLLRSSGAMVIDLMRLFDDDADSTLLSKNAQRGQDLLLDLQAARRLQRAPLCAY